MVVGCGAHFIQNYLQTVTDVLPVRVKALVVKIYKYVYIYTMRMTWLKMVLHSGNICFLSLLPAVERNNQICDGLKS